MYKRDGTEIGKRTRSTTWSFDARDSMLTWVEEAGAAGELETENLGRALGGTIVNGWALNAAGACDNNHYATNTTVPTGCYLPDAIYFASNIGDADLPTGKGTCAWVEYDNGGRMTAQTVSSHLKLPVASQSGIPVDSVRCGG